MLSEKNHILYGKCKNKIKNTIGIANHEMYDKILITFNYIFALKTVHLL
jgi:hypothetical protein